MARETVEDGFEDGDYSSDPTWSDYATGGGTFTVQGVTVKNGSYSLKYESDGQGDGGKWDINCTVLDSSNLVDGLVFQAWVRQSNVNIRANYLLSSPGGWMVIRSANGTGDVEYYGDNVNATTFYSTLSPDTWYRFKMVWHPSSVDFILEDATGSQLASATGINVTSDYNVTESRIMNRDDVSSVAYNYFDDVSYKTQLTGIDITGTVTLGGSAIQDAFVDVYDPMRDSLKDADRTDGTGNYRLIVNNKAGRYLVSVNYYDPSSDTYFGDEKSIMRNFADGLETGKFQRWWTVNDSGFSIKTNNIYQGSYSCGIETGNTSTTVPAEIMFSDWIGGVQPSQVEFKWYETSSSYGGGIQFINSNGNEEVGLATNNPQWDAYDTSGWNQVYNPGDYGDWTLFRLENFDWSANTCDYYMEDLTDGDTASGSLNLINGVDIEKIDIINYTGSSLDTGNMYMWFDNITVLYL